MNALTLAVAICCILLVRVGLMLFEAGVSRSKNAASAVMRNFCDLAVTTLAFWAVGGAVLQQDHNPWFGISVSSLFSNDTDLRILVALPLVLIATGQAIGAIGERGRFVLIPVLSAIMALLVVPTAGHWVWMGFLKNLGVIDVAGALPLHVSSACVGLTAAVFAGARTGKYNRDGSVNGIPGHNVVLMTAGTMLMICGLLAYLGLAAGMEADRRVWPNLAVLGGILAAATGACAAMLYARWRFGKVEVLLTLLGSLAGIIATTAGAGLLPAWTCALLGALGGIAACWFALWLDIRWKVDEASGLASAVGAGAVVSVLATPLLIGGALSARLSGLGANALGLVLTILLAGGITALAMWVTGKITKLRVSEADEYDGLDLSEHDVNAYPDFQQTMIKSYHLRQV